MFENGWDSCVFCIVVWDRVGNACLRDLIYSYTDMYLDLPIRLSIHTYIHRYIYSHLQTYRLPENEKDPIPLHTERDARHRLAIRVVILLQLTQRDNSSKKTKIK